MALSFVKYCLCASWDNFAKGCPQVSQSSILEAMIGQKDMIHPSIHQHSVLLSFPYRVFELSFGCMMANEAVILPNVQ